jgi:YggT family protein
MLNQAAQFLIDTVLTLFLWAFVLRFYLNLVRAPFGNPVGHFVKAFTGFAVQPLRRILRAWRNIDWASLLLAIITALLLETSLYWLAGVGLSASSIPALLLLAIAHILRTLIYILMIAVIVQAVMSWFAPYHPVSAIAMSLSAPVLLRAQRLIPPIGGIDLSPMVVLIVCELLLMVPVTWLNLQGQALLVRF